MTFKKAIGKLHLWLGLASGLVVFIVSSTGCIYVFQKELFELTHQELIHVAAPANTQPLPISDLWAKAQQAVGKDKLLLSGTTFHDPDRAWAFMAYKGTIGELYFGKLIDYYETVYVNPYTGAVTGVLDNKYEFFQVVKNVHWSLLLGTWGEYIVGWSTLIFVLLLLSGLVLWWPKNKNARKQRFSIKWDASPKRLNYDLHNVLGFYLSLVGLIIAITGLFWAFKWVDKSLNYLATGRTEQSRPKPEKVLPAASVARPWDLAFQQAWQRSPTARTISTSLPKEADKPIMMRVSYGENRYQGGQLSFHPQSGAFLAASYTREKPAGEQLLLMNYDIHVGSVLGLPTKVLAFLSSLLIASMPITGFYIWWGRRNKKKTARPAAVKKAVSQPVPVH